MLANTYVVGAPKAATTSLADWLGQHPEIYWSKPKEPFYWAADYPAMRAHYGFATQAQYEQLFDSDEARSKRLRGDGSTTYLYSTEAVPAIERAVPDAKYIVAVREPVSLLRSYHRTQVVALNEVEEDFFAAWQRSLGGSIGASQPLDPQLLDYAQVGAQGAAVERLLSTVPRERVLVLVFDDLVADPASAWVQITRFLEVAAEPVPDFRARNASEVAYRSGALRRLTHRPPRLLAPLVRSLRQWSRTTDSAAVRRLKAWMWVQRDRPESVSHEDVTLREHFAGDVELLSRLLERDLSALWSKGADSDAGEEFE